MGSWFFDQCQTWVSGISPQMHGVGYVTGYKSQCIVQKGWKNSRSSRSWLQNALTAWTIHLRTSCQLLLHNQSSLFYNTNGGVHPETWVPRHAVEKEHSHDQSVSDIEDRNSNPSKRQTTAEPTNATSAASFQEKHLQTPWLVPTISRPGTDTHRSNTWGNAPSGASGVNSAYEMPSSNHA